MRRRGFLGATAAALAAPRLAQAEGSRVLKFIPQADLGVLDPVWTQIYVVGAHGTMIFDTLYGLDSNYNPQPQMAEGHRVEDDGKTWLIRLRPGLVWHDGEKVLARDCVASIQRWGARDGYGGTLMAATDQVDAPDDHTIRFRLKHPFPLLPNALGKVGPSICAMMPERLAKTDPFKQVTEMVGSGPFRFVAGEQVAGSLIVYERNAAYVPRPNGEASFTAGPKVVHMDRVEWHILPDTASAAAAMQTSEIDWWENPAYDVLPVLREAKNLVVTHMNEFGSMAGMRFNQLHPPFNNPALRRAILSAVDQEVFMTSMATTDKRNWRTGIGFFCPASSMANQAGMQPMHPIEVAKKAVAESGYQGERVVVPVASDYPTFQAIGNVGLDLLQQLGLNVEMRSADWASLQRGLNSREPIDRGGWSLYMAHPSGLDFYDPANHYWLRANGKGAARGWPDSPKIEAIRDTWLVAPDHATRKRLAEDIQRQAYIDVPYVPLGQALGSTVHQKSVSGIVKGGGPIFWSVRKG
jgi:peptide/nickel transport system substrate-binding protein